MEPLATLFHFKVEFPSLILNLRGYQLHTVLVRIEADLVCVPVRAPSIAVQNLPRRNLA